MTPPGVAVWLDSYRTGLKTALRLAARDGYRRVWGQGTNRDWDPRELTRSGRRHLARYLRDLGCQLHGLAVESSGHGLADPRQVSARVERFRQTLELCAELRAPQASVSLSGFAAVGTADLANELLVLVADLSNRFGVQTAIDTGAEDVAAALEPVQRLACPQVRLSVDTGRLPANATSIDQCAALLGLVQLRDARLAGDRVEEAPFGEGQVDFPRLLAELAKSGYAGSYVVRRDTATAEVDSLRQGREYIERLLGSAPLR